MLFLNKPVEELKNFVCEYKTAYAMAHPFPRIYFNDFIKRNTLREILKDFFYRLKSLDLKLCSKKTVSFITLSLFLHYLNTSIN
jgi:hypothetical protein